MEELHENTVDGTITLEQSRSQIRTSQTGQLCQDMLDGTSTLGHSRQDDYI